MTVNRIARLISNVFDPIPMTVLVGILGIVATPMTPAERWFWIVLIAGMCVMLGFVLVWFVRQGYVFDAKLSAGTDHHRDRLGALWIANGLLAVAVLISYQLGRGEPLWSILLGMTAVLVSATIITGWYKISLHMIGVTSLVTILMLEYRAAALPALLLIPLMAWSRRALDRHTTWQMVWGALLASAVLVMVFVLTGHLLAEALQE